MHLGSASKLLFNWFSIALFLLSTVANSAAEEFTQVNPMFTHSVAVSSGMAMNAPLLQILTLTNFDFKPFYITDFAFAKVISTDHKNFAFETEVHALKHWEYFWSFEFTGVVLIRWMNFPWDRYLKTTIAAGGGVSWVSQIPGYEEQYQLASNPILHHLAFEVELALAAWPQWRVYVRDHHRSGVWGLFNNVWGGSDYMCFGIRYRY